MTVNHVLEEADDLKMLTSGTFLYDLREYEMPDLDLLDNSSLKKRFKRKQKLMKYLKKRLRKEYLGHRQQQF